jgi:hypothetical protein
MKVAGEGGGVHEYGSVDDFYFLETPGSNWNGYGKGH